MPALSSFVAGYSLASCDCDAGNRRARLRNTHPLRKAAVDVQPFLAPVETSVAVRKQKWIPFQRNKQFSPLETEVPLELIGRDAGHNIGNVIQLERFTDDLRIGTQVVLPELVSQNHDGVRLPFESRSARQRHADRLEVVGRDVHRPQRPTSVLPEA